MNDMTHMSENPQGKDCLASLLYSNDVQSNGNAIVCDISSERNSDMNSTKMSNINTTKLAAAIVNTIEVGKSRILNCRKAVELQREGGLKREELRAALDVAYAAKFPTKTSEQIALLVKVALHRVWPLKDTIEEPKMTPEVSKTLKLFSGMEYSVIKKSCRNLAEYIAKLEKYQKQADEQLDKEEAIEELAEQIEELAAQ